MCEMCHTTFFDSVQVSRAWKTPDYTYNIQAQKQCHISQSTRNVILEILDIDLKINSWAHSGFEDRKKKVSK